MYLSIIIAVVVFVSYLAVTTERDGHFFKNFAVDFVVSIAALTAAFIALAMIFLFWAAITGAFGPAGSLLAFAAANGMWTLVTVVRRVRKHINK